MQRLGSKQVLIGSLRANLFWKYHLKKYINEGTAHLDEDSLDRPDKEMAKEIFDKILNRTDAEKKGIVVKAARKYRMQC